MSLSYIVLFFIKKFYINYTNGKKFCATKITNWKKICIAKIYIFKSVLKNIILKIINSCSNLLHILNFSKLSIPEYERMSINKFYEEMQSLNYPELYKSLTKNLSSKSIKCVDNIISKIKLVSENNIIVHDILFSKQEQKQIKKVLLDLFFNIKKINDNCYRYKKYKLPINHFEGSVFYYKHNVDSLNKMLFNNKDIIDVGGYIGDSAIVFSPYTNGMIYSFEPTTGLYNFMQQTLKLNQKCKNIVPINIGLGSKKEKQLIHLMDSGSSINRLIVLNEYETEEIEITTLDDYVKENNLNNIGLIKVDIEGFEQEFLKGAINTIITQKPTLLLSIYHFATDFFNIKSIIEKLNLGYKYRIVKPLDGTIRGEILLICEQ